MIGQLGLLGSTGWCDVEDIAGFLDRHHYLGRVRVGRAWRDEHGVLVLAPPTSRHLPDDWLELTRWCLLPGRPNAGSTQWACVREALIDCAVASTVVSYSDPSQGHTGALYRACNWLWAPTWIRLRPPPSGNGDWGTGAQAPKDRWVDPLMPGERRPDLLAVDDDAVLKRWPWASYQEPTWKGRRRRRGGGDYKRWIREATR